MIKRLRQSCL